MKSRSLQKWYWDSISRYENTLLNLEMNTLSATGLCSTATTQLQKPDPATIINETAQNRLDLQTTPLNSRFVAHPANWTYVDAVGLHTSSKRLLNSPELYSGFSSSLAIAGLLTPHLIFSKKNVASYKLTKGSLIGSKALLRGQIRKLFLYKMCFLAGRFKDSGKTNPLVMKQLKNLKPQQKQIDNCCLVGVSDIYFMPEMEYSDFELYSQIPGLDIRFHFNFEVQ